MATVVAKPFSHTMCDNNVKLMFINAETNAALNLHEETIFYPKGQTLAVMYL